MNNIDVEMSLLQAPTFFSKGVILIVFELLLFLVILFVYKKKKRDYSGLAVLALIIMVLTLIVSLVLTYLSVLPAYNLTN